MDSRANGRTVVVIVVFFLLFVLLPPSLHTWVVGLSTTTADHARWIRSQYGHEAAQSQYQELLHQAEWSLDGDNDKAGTVGVDVHSAALCLAASPDTPERHDKACKYRDVLQVQQVATLLDGFTKEAVDDMFGIPPDMRYASSPFYVQQSTAHRHSSKRPPPPPTSKLSCLVSLFLMSRVLSLADTQRLLGGEAPVRLLQDLGLLFVDNDGSRVIPYVHICPLCCTGSHGQGTDLWFVTDLHPSVLSTTTVGRNSDGTVMYIGPDSLALVQHTPPVMYAGAANVLDLCTGSGIQAIVALTNTDTTHHEQQHHSDNDHNRIPSRATCVDINPRALRFVEFNALLNGISLDRVRCICLDITKEPLADVASTLLSTTTNKEFDLVLANPPFIPVPPSSTQILQRYGLFSSGGADGETVLKRVVKLASRLLHDYGTAAIVSEFVNAPSSTNNNNNTDQDNDQPSLLCRIQSWWTSQGMGVLFTNEFPVDANVYAARRADSVQEETIWRQHLQDSNVRCVSPGLLYLRKVNHSGTTIGDDSLSLLPKATRRASLKLTSAPVPRTNKGSIWTPSNQDAVTFTRGFLERFMIQEQQPDQ